MQHRWLHSKQHKKSSYLSDGFDKADPIIGPFYFSQTVSEVIPVVFLCTKKRSFLLLVKLTERHTRFIMDSHLSQEVLLEEHFKKSKNFARFLLKCILSSISKMCNNQMTK